MNSASDRPRAATLALVSTILVGPTYACSSRADSDPSPSAKSTKAPQPGDDSKDSSSKLPSVSPGPDKSPSPSDSEHSPSADAEDDPGTQDSVDSAQLPKFDLGTIPSPGPDKPKDGDDCDCEPGADLIFLWADTGALWTYNPSKSGNDAFKNLGKPNCPGSASQYAFSMGVDRHSNAWLSYRPSGTLYKVDTKNGNRCVDSGHKPGTEGFTLFGMAYVEHPNDGVCEQLYMHSFAGDAVGESPNAGKLGTMDPETLKIRQISRINFNGGELTGTADGRLFAFAGIPARLLEYNPKTGEIIDETTLGLDLTSAFAFAFWGGDFYFFTEAPGGLQKRSMVTKLDYDGDGSLKTIVDRSPLRVAGAGVSVCAPLDEPPPG